MRKIFKFYNISNKRVIIGNKFLRIERKGLTNFLIGLFSKENISLDMISDVIITNPDEKTCGYLRLYIYI